MKEIKGNIWDFHDKGNWIVITTNGTVKANGEAVMGRGVALQAKQRFPKLPQYLGMCLSTYGNNVTHLDDPYHMISFPVKHNWWEKADLALIEESAKILAKVTREDGKVYMVRPGCGNGGLNWKDVKPILEKYLDNRFIIVERSP